MHVAEKTIDLTDFLASERSDIGLMSELWHEKTAPVFTQSHLQQF